MVSTKRAWLVEEDSMNCPKCGSEMHNIGWYPDYFWQCRKCGHEEKVGGEKR